MVQEHGEQTFTKIWTAQRLCMRGILVYRKHKIAKLPYRAYTSPVFGSILVGFNFYYACKTSYSTSHGNLAKNRS
jgi:hypothetical protein